MDVRIGTEFEGESYRSVAAVDDAPEEYMQRRGGGEEESGEEGVEMEVAAGQGGEVAGGVGAVAGWATGQVVGDLEEEFVG